MEEVRDLLVTKKQNGGLRIRQHPKKGFYGESLSRLYAAATGVSYVVGLGTSYSCEGNLTWNCIHD